MPLIPYNPPSKFKADEITNIDIEEYGYADLNEFKKNSSNIGIVDEKDYEILFEYFKKFKFKKIDSYPKDVINSKNLQVRFYLKDEQNNIYFKEISKEHPNIISISHIRLNERNEEYYEITDGQIDYDYISGFVMEHGN